ncbi:sodium leak channel non-selective protein [Anopheles sinensis]|uniref:Sodium leak channel non-selective protein n=1 Tax=Anopheles sinensis TaxID=74873 RepID=A0A084WQ26_ANOSI|nr:sodium leak channel non-selective protein [Anopheles sinensis]
MSHQAHKRDRVRVLNGRGIHSTPSASDLQNNNNNHNIPPPVNSSQFQLKCTETPSAANRKTLGTASSPYRTIVSRRAAARFATHVKVVYLKC